jgi:hypothetical protein
MRERSYSDSLRRLVGAQASWRLRAWVQAQDERGQMSLWSEAVRVVVSRPCLAGQSALVPVQGTTPGRRAMPAPSGGISEVQASSTSAKWRGRPSAWTAPFRLSSSLRPCRR